MPPKRSSSWLVARDAIVVNVGARPIKYGQIKVRDRHTGEVKTIDNQNDIVDSGDEGMPYAFKQNQRVSKNHPAVKACPGAFIPAEDVDESELLPAA
jgi:hypothetical protein